MLKVTSARSRLWRRIPRGFTVQNVPQKYTTCTRNSSKKFFQTASNIILCKPAPAEIRQPGIVSIQNQFVSISLKDRQQSFSSQALQKTSIKAGQDGDGDGDGDGQISPSYASDGVHARAEVKINILNEARALANQSRALYMKSKKTSNALSEESLQNMHDNWKEHEVKLSDAYSKAIKYTARLRKKDVASNAQRLLDDMIKRHSTIQEETNFLSTHDGPQFLDSTVLDLVKAIDRDSRSSTNSTPVSPTIDSIRDGIPIPTSKDFANVLHSWASSKVKRKGLYAESLLWRMLELSYFYPEHFGMPDSKMFGLVIKCYAGSTFKDAFRRIKKLHGIHEKLAAMSIPGIRRDDPFFLMHSIKSVQNYGSAEERVLVDDWFDRLHNCVINSPSQDGDFTEIADINNAGKEAIDLSGTYTSIIRGYAKMRRQPDAAEKSLQALNRMRELHELASLSESPVATVDLKINAFNLFLGSTIAPKDYGMLSKKLALLNDLIEPVSDGKDSSINKKPLPNDQSFVSCLKALSMLSDPLQATNEAARITAAYESLVSGKRVDLSPKVHNSTINLYIEILARDKDSIGSMIPICAGILQRMKQLAQSDPDIGPDTYTYTSILKACSIDDTNPDNKVERYEKATQIFHHLVDAKNDLKVNDKCYFYMMKCVANTSIDPEERSSRIIELFSEAASKGLVSADVLKTLRSNASNEVFTQIAGDGRLADNWVENVTSSLALYTDGTTGGAGKNARRKGKSTSNWAKRENERKGNIMHRKHAKIDKKRLKHERELKGKRRRK